MPDTAVLTEEKKKEEQSPLAELREKSFEQILREQSESRTTPEDTSVVSDEDKKKIEEDKQAQEAKDAQEKIEAEEQDRKRQEELAEKAAEQVLNKQKEQEEARLEKTKQKEAEDKQQDDLKPRFTGRDKDGNVVPLSYEELTAESVRIAEEKAVSRMRAEQVERENKVRADTEQQKATQEEQLARTKAFDDQLQKELDTDLADLYTKNLLPKIKDPKDENDPGNKEFKNLFETAQRVNAELMAQGKSPIRSIKLIYYEHYKPLTTLPGHNAPVMGSESPLSNEAPEDRYIPARDRNKTIEQLVKEEAQRLGRKLNIRSN